MVTTKKLKDLTQQELLRCGWIEKVAFRGAEDKTASTDVIKTDTVVKQDEVMGR